MRIDIKADTSPSPETQRTGFIVTLDGKEIARQMFPIPAAITKAALRILCAFFAVLALLSILGTAGAVECGAVSVPRGVFGMATGCAALALFGFLAGGMRK